LTEWFSQHFPVKHSLVVLDTKTKTSRGYGFVTFTDTDDTVQAQASLNNKLMDGRRLTLEVAQPRHRAAAKSGNNAVSSRLAEEKKKREDAIAESRKLPKLIVRNLPWSIKKPEQLAALFRNFGKIKYADLPSSNGKLAGFGFVTLRSRKGAEKALEIVNGWEVDGRTIAVDWAVDKQTWEKQQHTDENGPAENGTGDAVSGDAERGDDDEEAGDDMDVDHGDEDTEEDDPDVRNFLKNHMENLEDEDGSVDAKDEDDWEDEDESDGGGAVAKLETPKKALSTDNSTTVFVRNIPYTATDATLKEHFAQFGGVRYARVVMDRTTDRPAGTGFVCFFSLEHTMACLKGAPRQRPATALGKRSVLQDEMVDRDGRYTLEGRLLQVAQAVSKDEATRLTADRTAARTSQDKDKRRMFLLSEGAISKNSPIYASLPPTEIQMREASMRQRKKMIESNPSLHLSLTRLAIRNIPRNIDSKGLKALAREAVVGFAKDVKEGLRQPLSKEENARGGQTGKDAEHRRKEKKKGVVKQAKIVFESKEGSKVAEAEAGGGKSRGYGFIEYSSHRWALMGLRWLNGHALKNESGKTTRLIVEFAIENANVVSRRRANEEKSRNREPAASRPAGSKPPTARGGKREEKGPRVNGRKGSKTKGTERVQEPVPQEANGKGGKQAKADAKLAMRQRIIGRKRLMRKKKGQARGT